MIRPPCWCVAAFVGLSLLASGCGGGSKSPSLASRTSTTASGVSISSGVLRWMGASLSWFHRAGVRGFSERRAWECTDVGGLAHRDRCAMEKRFAVVFREGNGPRVAGSLEAGPDRLLLSGRGEGRSITLRVRPAGVSEVRVGRRPADRLNGYPTLVLEREGLPPVQVAPLGVGSLHEIVDLVGELQRRHGAGDQLVVAVPLKPGCLGRARRLLAHGPPVDPAALGLTGHTVYLREGEAVFVFRGPDVDAKVSRAMRSTAVWRAGLAWQECIAGRPRLYHSTDILSREATVAFSWSAGGAAATR